jgi:hypothetical protein
MLHSIVSTTGETEVHAAVGEFERLIVVSALTVNPIGFVRCSVGTLGLEFVQPQRDYYCVTKGRSISVWA